MSRSIGDWDMVGVIAEPIVDVVDLNTINIPSKIDHETCSTTANENCQATSDLASNGISVFAISATDGMMDYLLPQELSTMIARAFYDADGPHPLTAIEDGILQAATLGTTTWAVNIETILSLSLPSLMWIRWRRSRMNDESFLQYSWT
jgi:hypothetical protein